MKRKSRISNPNKPYIMIQSMSCKKGEIPKKDKIKSNKA